MHPLVQRAPPLGNNRDPLPTLRFSIQKGSIGWAMALADGGRVGRRTTQLRLSRKASPMPSRLNARRRSEARRAEPLGCFPVVDGKWVRILQARGSW